MIGSLGDRPTQLLFVDDEEGFLRYVERNLMSSDRNFHDLRGRIVLRPFPG